MPAARTGARAQLHTLNPLPCVTTSPPHTHLAAPRPPPLPLQQCLGHNESEVRLAAMKAACVFISELESAEDRDKFQATLPALLACIGRALNEGDESAAQVGAGGLLVRWFWARELPPWRPLVGSRLRMPALRRLKSRHPSRDDFGSVRGGPGVC